jgi:hypothetical protein
MDKLERYYNHIVDHMLKNTEIYLNFENAVGIKFPQYPDADFYYYDEDEIKDWLKYGWTGIGTDDRNYLTNMFGVRYDETDGVINRYVKKLSQFILDKYY